MEINVADGHVNDGNTKQQNWHSLVESLVHVSIWLDEYGNLPQILQPPPTNPVILHHVSPEHDHEMEVIVPYSKTNHMKRLKLMGCTGTL